MTVHTWIHLCATWDLKLGVIDVAGNGKVIAENRRDAKLQKENITLDKIQFGSKLGGVEAIGKENGHRSFIGSLNIYNKKTLEEMVRLTQTSCSSEGDLLAWRDVEYEMVGSWEEEKGIDEKGGDQVCTQGSRDRLLIIPTHMPQSMAVSICDRMGDRMGNSQLYFPPNRSEADAFFDAHWSHSDGDLPKKEQCVDYWTPYKWEDGVVVDGRFSAPATFVPWFAGEGQGESECVKMLSREGTMVLADNLCDEMLCAVCSRSPVPQSLL